MFITIYKGMYFISEIAYNQKKIKKIDKAKMTILN